MGQCQWHTFPCCLGPPVPKTKVLSLLGSPRAGLWECAVVGWTALELQSQMFALVNQEGRRGADTQSGSLPQTGDKPTRLLLWGTSSQHTPICLHPPLQHSLCSIHVGSGQYLCSMHVSSFLPPFYPARFSSAVLLVSWLNSHSQLLGMIQSSLVTGRWFVGHIWMASR